MRRRVGNDTASAILARRVANAIRLAILFAISDMSLVVKEAHLRAALSWIHYSTESVRFVFAERAAFAAEEQMRNDARNIFDFLAKQLGGATLTAIGNSVLQKKASADRLGAALRYLLTTHPPLIELVEIPRPAGSRGKKTKLYRALVNAISDFSDFSDFAAALGP